MKTPHLALVTLVSLLALAGCGGSDSTADSTTTPAAGGSTQLPYDDSQTKVLGAGGQATTQETPTGSGCIMLPSGCVSPTDLCKKQGVETGRIDVIVDKSGNVVDAVCYPTGGATVVPGESTGDVVAGNKGIIALDNKDEPAPDIAGDANLDGNNATIYGESPATAVIGGDLNASGNNAVASGVHIRGNANLSGNNASLVNCIVDGDIVIKGNNAVVYGCTVWGLISIEGNNNAIINNVVLKTISGGQNTVCSGNSRLNDKDNDKVFDGDGEIGPDLACTEGTSTGVDPGNGNGNGKK